MKSTNNPCNKMSMRKKLGVASLCILTAIGVGVGIELGKHLPGKLSGTVAKMPKLASPLDSFTQTGKVWGQKVTYTKEKDIRLVSYTTSSGYECAIQDTNNDGIIPNHKGDFIKTEKNGKTGLYTMEHKSNTFPHKLSLGIYGLSESRKPLKQKASEFFQLAVDELTESYKKSLKEKVEQ